MSAPSSSTARRRWPFATTARRVATFAVALLIGGAIAVPAVHASTTGPAQGPVAQDEPSAEPLAAGAASGLVVVGTGGLHWTDIDRTSTPTLWRMIAGGSVGSISVRTGGTRTCPIDAWSTVSAGQRWSVVPQAEDEAAPGRSVGVDDVLDGCTEMPSVAPTTTGAEGPSPHAVEGWTSFFPDEPAEVEGASSAGDPGTLAALIGEAGACTTAVGPGAAVALADGEGHVARYVPTLADLAPAELTTCPVVVVDTGELGEDRAERQKALRVLDVTLLGLLEKLPDDWRVVVAGVSDTPVAEEGLQAVIDWERGGRAAWLTSDSTRRAGIVTLPDLAAAAVDAAGGDLTDLVGAPLADGADRRMSVQRTVENRRYLTEMTTTVTHVMPVFAAVVLLAGLAAGMVLWRAWRRPAGLGPASRRVVTAVLLLVSAAPGGAFLAALSRWWVTPEPLVGAAVSAAVGTVLLALVAWVVSRAFPPGRWTLAAVSAGLTWLVLTVDGLSGTLLQQGSILGSTPTFGARYYGFGNLAFSVYAVSALVMAGGLAVLVARAGRPRLTLAVVLSVAVVTVGVDGWPGFGADVGGILALVPAFAVLALGVGGSGLTPRRALGAGALALVVTTVVAIIDWMGPGPSSHLGLFVRRVIDGQAVQVVLDKSSGAWATIANPAGAVATVICLLVGVALVGPERWRPPAVRDAYGSWTMLRPVVGSVVVAAALGTLLNDSGISVAVVVLGLAAALLAASACSGTWSGAGMPTGPSGSSDAPVRRMPSVILAAGGGLLAVLLLGVGFAPLPTVAAGDVTDGRGEAVATVSDPVVVIGTAGVRWQDVTPAATPTLWGLVRDGAAVAGVAPGVSGIDGRCLSAGWLSLSAGRAAVAGHSLDGTWGCDTWTVVPDLAPAFEARSPGASIAGWAGLDALQSSSEFDPRLGVLAESLETAGACATAVGPGAALALADSDGRVQRYRELDDALADRADTFACPVTVIDLGTVPFAVGSTPVASAVDPVAPLATPAGPARSEALAGIDSALRRVLAIVPEGTSVLVVDTGNPAAGPISLGFGAAPMDGETGARFLSTPSTRWEGVVRLLDVPTTVLYAVGAANPVEFTGSPLMAAGTRATEASGVVDQLVDLSVRDQALRGRSGTVTTIPLLVSLVLLGLTVLVLPRLAGRRPAAVRWVGAVVDGAQLLLASLPAGLFLMTAWSWWRADSPQSALWWSMAASTVVVAAVAALVPRRPIWGAPTVISALTFVLLTVDALLGTPLHRGSPLGPAPTLGGRYYGFGNPTYSIYVVVALVAAAGLGSALLARGHRRLAVAVAGAVSLVALAVDILPTLGADVGGGLVLLPASAIVVLGVARARVTWRRLGVIGLVGVVAVACVGLLDWLRPPAERSHLGRFVQSAIDGTAWETVARKAGYAAATVTSGPTAWLTLALVVVVLLLLWRGSPVRAAWFSRLEDEWPLARPLFLGILVAAIGGSLVNDYGTRIATVLLAAAVPLVGLLVARSLPERTDLPDG